MLFSGLAAGALLLPAWALAQPTNTTGATQAPNLSEQQDIHRGSTSTSGSSNAPATMPGGTTRESNSATSPSAQANASATTSNTATAKKHRKHKSHTNTQTGQPTQAPRS
jgi:hypothetical protein